MHHHPLYAWQYAQGFKGHRAPFAVPAQPREATGDCAVEPVQFAFEADTGFIGVHHRTGLHGLADGFDCSAQASGQLFSCALDTRLAHVQAKSVLHEGVGACHGHKVVLVQMHSHGFGVNAVLGGGFDAIWPDSQMDLPAAAYCAHELVLGNPYFDGGYVKDLAFICYLLRRQRFLAGGAYLWGAVYDGFVDAAALAQCCANMAFLAPCGALAGDALGFGGGFAVAVARWGFAGVAAVEA